MMDQNESVTKQIIVPIEIHRCGRKDSRLILYSDCIALALSIPTAWR